jgi:hydrogenase maturation protease
MTNALRPIVKKLVLGVGNPIGTDDGVGIHVARELMKLNLPGVQVEELPASGLELLDMVVGYDKVIIVDAIRTKGGEPGDFYTLTEDDFVRCVHGASPHGINIPTALAMGRRIIPDQMPRELVFIAVEVEDIENVSEKLTPKVARALPEVLERVKKELGSVQ